MIYLVRDIKIYVNNEASFINYCPNTIYIRNIYILFCINIYGNLILLERIYFH